MYTKDNMPQNGHDLQTHTVTIIHQYTYNIVHTYQVVTMPPQTQTHTYCMHRHINGNNHMHARIKVAGQSRPRK